MYQYIDIYVDLHTYTVHKKISTYINTKHINNACVAGWPPQWSTGNTR